MSATERLKQFTARINRLMDERDALTSDIGDVYQEVKSAGFSGPALRKVIAALRMDESKRTEIEAMVEMYRAAVGLARPEAVEMLESGKTLRETNRATGVALGTLHRRSKTVPKEKTEHPKSEATSGAVASRSPAVAAVASPLPLADVGAFPPAALDTPDDPDWERRDGAATYDGVRQIQRDTLVASGAARLHPDPLAVDAPLELPAFLRRA